MPPAFKQNQPERIVGLREFASEMGDFSKISGMVSHFPDSKRLCGWLDRNGGLLSRLRADLSSGKLEADWTMSSEAGQTAFLKIAGSYENANLYAIGVWLGKQFLFDQYDLKSPKDIPIRQDWAFENLCYYEQETHLLYYFPLGIGASPAEAFLRGFKVGLHEVTHGLKQARDGKAATLSEFSTALTGEICPPMRMGASDLSPMFEKEALRMRQLIADGRVKMGYDEYIGVAPYLVHYAMPWIGAWKEKQGGKFDVFDFEIATKGLDPKKVNREKLGDLVLKDIYASGLRSGSNAALERDFADYACKISGITNAELGKKIADLFMELGASGGWKNEKEFLDKLDSALSKVFGQPKKADYPEDYGHDLGERKGAFFS